jgi:hypothetical protein
MICKRCSKLEDPHRDCQLLPVGLAPQLWAGQQQGLIAFVPVLVLAIWILLAVLRNGSLFIGCGVADDFAYQNRNHTQLSRPGHPLRPRPNRPEVPLFMFR